MNEQPNHATYTEGRIGRQLATMASHMLVGHIAIAAFNFTDTFFVARLGERPLAAMSFVRPMAMTGFSVMFGLGIGVSAVLSKLVGQGDGLRVRRLASDTIRLTVTLGVLLAGLFACIAYPLFYRMGARGETLVLALQYVSIWIMGFPIGVLPMVMNNSIRANGDTRTPALIMSISAGLNGLMDPILIFGVADLGLLGGPGVVVREWLLGIGVPDFPGMGIRGAAWATVISRCMSTVAALSIIHFRLKLLSFRWPGVRAILDSWKRLLTIGVPAGMTHCLNPLSLMLVTGFVAVAGGDAAVAAMGPGAMVEFIAMLPVFSCASVLLPFVGQNSGAGRFDRVREVLRRATIFAIVWSVLIAGVLYVSATPIASIFIRPAASEAGPDQGQLLVDLTRYIRIVPWGLLFVGVIVIGASVLNALHRPVHAVIVNVTRTFVFMVPLCFVGGRWFGVPGVFTGMVLGSIPAAAVAMVLVRRELGKQTREHAGVALNLGPSPEEQAPSGDEWDE
jgi:putative MATE family efflux protein